MKKFLPIYLGVLLLISTVCIVFLTNKDNIDTTDTTSNRFKNEYSAYNNMEIDGKTYPYVDISSSNLYYYATLEEIKSIMDSGSGVIYFGFPTCPWCRNMVSILNDVGITYKIDKIYYYNIKDIRTTFTLDDNNNLIKSDGTEFYYYLLEKLDNFLEDYSYNNIATNEKRLYAPTVVFINNGEVKDVVVGTVATQNDPFVSLTSDQREELKNKYADGFKKLNTVCSNDGIAC